ncbi:MAG: hypothetical protein GY765_25735, partial [bacterium]|nr:hypothetical protein [bacterium]
IASLASLIKTAGLLFFLYFFILLVFKYGVSLKLFKRLSTILAAFLVVFCWFNFLFPARFFNLYGVLFFKLRGLISAGSVVDTYSGFGYFDSIFTSFYFYTGWMGYTLNKGWYLLLQLFLLASLAGTLGVLTIKKSVVGIIERKWLTFCLIVTLLQLAAVRFYYGNGLMAQGRYMFPLLIPILVLMYFGLGYIETILKFPKPYLKTAYILFQAVLFLFALMRVMSVFYLEIASPHIGL